MDIVDWVVVSIVIFGIVCGLLFIGVILGRRMGEQDGRLKGWNEAFDANAIDRCDFWSFKGHPNYPSSPIPPCPDLIPEQSEEL